MNRSVISSKDIATKFVATFLPLYDLQHLHLVCFVNFKASKIFLIYLSDFSIDIASTVPESSYPFENLCRTKYNGEAYSRRFDGVYRYCCGTVHGDPIDTTRAPAPIDTTQAPAPIETTQAPDDTTEAPATVAGRSAYLQRIFCEFKPKT
jgi:hypothetical protein